MGDLENIKLEYIRADDNDTEKNKKEDYLVLLYKYLNEFISRETLKEDIEYCLDNGRVIGAYHEQKLIGAVVGVYTPFFDKFHIAHIAVEESYQGKGIGRRLTERVIPEDKGASVHLNTDNPEIEKFYESLGFKATHKRFKKPEKDSSKFKPSD